MEDRNVDVDVEGSSTQFKEK